MSNLEILGPKFSGISRSDGQYIMLGGNTKINPISGLGAVLTDEGMDRPDFIGEEAKTLIGQADTSYQYISGDYYWTRATEADNIVQGGDDTLEISGYMIMGDVYYGDPNTRVAGGNDIFNLQQNLHDDRLPRAWRHAAWRIHLGW